MSRSVNPLFGARPLKRAIRKYVEDPLAMELLENRFEEDSTILVDADDNGITFSARSGSDDAENAETTVIEAELVE